LRLFRHDDRVVWAALRLRRLRAIAEPGRLARGSSGVPVSLHAPITCWGQVSTAVGRLAVAAKARVIGSEFRNGGSVNSKRGSMVRSTASQPP